MVYLKSLVLSLLNFKVLSSSGTAYFASQSSRYLLITIKENEVKQFDAEENKIQISHKRITQKPKFKKTSVHQIIYYDFDAFFFMDKHPEYPGGIKNFYNFIRNQLVYPQAALINNIEGTVSISFKIDIKGLAKDFIITRDIGYCCSDELLKIPKNIPAICGGVPTDQFYSLTIPFKLTD